MHWEYTKRRDGKIAITLDNNVWNFLFEKRIDLDSELPPDQFAIFIPREVEIEALAIPAHPSKSELKDYIARTIVSCGIRTTSVFGFATGGPGPQRYGGVGQGTWQSQTEREFYAAIREQYLIGRSIKNSQLGDNEGDAAVAAKSFFSVVLTCEHTRKTGPLRFAAEHGGKILCLADFDPSKLTLKAYIEAFYRQYDQVTHRPALLCGFRNVVAASESPSFPLLFREKLYEGVGDVGTVFFCDALAGLFDLLHLSAQVLA